MTWFETVWHNFLRRPYRLQVHDYGGAGPVIIFLHGIAASSEDWRFLVAVLRHEYRCMTIDLLGFARSPKPEWYAYTMEDHVRALHYTIRRLHLRTPFTLVGHSLGSLLATRYTRDHQANVTRLLLLSPPVYAQLDMITSRTARARNALLLKLYRALRTHPRGTPATFRRLA